tara:strand:+ start:643 stop:1245 length:603 start_codon:yes stop_codon:yes gene_type:complete
MGVISNGTTMLDNGALDSGVATGKLTLISTTNVSSSASTVSITSGINSTYEKYIFKLINIHLSAQAYLQVNFRDGGSSYDANKITTMYFASHKEDDSDQELTFGTGNSLELSQGIQRLTSGEMDLSNDSNISGYICLFDPSNTTHVTHFIAQTQYMTNSPSSETSYIAGLVIDTAAVDGIQFSVSSGTIDSGTIKLYGVG